MLNFLYASCTLFAFVLAKACESPENYAHHCDTISGWRQRLPSGSTALQLNPNGCRRVASRFGGNSGQLHRKKNNGLANGEIFIWKQWEKYRKTVRKRSIFLHCTGDRKDLPGYALLGHCNFPIFLWKSFHACGISLCAQFQKKCDPYEAQKNAPQPGVGLGLQQFHTKLWYYVTLLRVWNDLKKK